MFFFAFFGALFFTRVISVPDLASADNALLWPGFQAVWPTAGPGLESRLHADGAMGHSGAEYRDPAQFRGYRDLGALGAETRPTRPTQFALALTVALGRSSSPSRPTNTPRPTSTWA
jgi:hypothetical protein